MNPQSNKRYEESLRKPALCELLPVREYLDGVMVQVDGSLVAGYELTGLNSFYHDDEMRNRSKHSLEALVRSLPERSMRLQMRFEIAQGIGPARTEYPRLQKSESAVLQEIDRHRMSRWDRRSEEGYYLRHLLHAYFIWNPRIHHELAGMMVELRRVHRTHEAQVVRDGTDVRQQIAQFHAALAVLGELPRTREHLRTSLRGVVVFDFAGEFLAVVFVQCGLGVEQIHVARPALHKHGNHRLGARLEVRARHVVEGFLSGMHRSPYFGQSVEFLQHREYVLGDDLRHVDWKVWARQDRLYVKQFEEETNLDCHIMLDELPYGNFIEIEGDDMEIIRAIADNLELNLQAAITVSYAALFERVKKTLRLPFSDLRFNNFNNLNLSPNDLQISFVI